MEMALPLTSAAVAATSSASDSDLSTLGGIEDLKLTVGPVRRSLFGPVDHHQLQQDFQRLLRVNAEVANKRWGFDFRSDRPAQGSATAMEWEEVRYRDVPAFYRSCVVRGVAGTKAPRRILTSSSASSSSSGQSSSSSSGSGDELPEEASRGRYRLQQPIKRRQASITDFYKVKRRRFLHYKGPSRE